MTHTSQEVRELIFQHFSFEDIIEVSQVSKDFYALTGSSEACMEKMQISVGKSKANIEDLQTSKRNYTNLKLHNFTEEAAEYLMKHSWRRVSFLIGSISDANCAKLLNMFAPAVCELEFYIEHIISRNVMTPIRFPKLESLTFRWTSKKIFEPFSGTQNDKLRNVIIELSKSGCFEAVESFIIQNKSISNLSIRLNKEDYCELFSRDISQDLRLRLSSLSFYWRLCNYIEPEIYENWKKFFLSQKDSLKRLVFECTFDCKDVLETIINEMHALEHLTFVDLDDETLLSSEKQDFKLTPNPSIRQIDICVDWFVSDEMFEELILASPNLQILYVFELSTRVMKFLVKNSKNLRSLIYEEIDSDCEETYDNMVINNEDIGVNKNVQFHWDQDFEVEFPKLHRNMQFS